MTAEEFNKQFPILCDRIEPGYRLTEMMVLHSNAGYYLGRMGWNPNMGGFEEPCSRESDYFTTKEEAEKALKGGFDLRDCLENNYGYQEGSLPPPPANARRKFT